MILTKDMDNNERFVKNVNFYKKSIASKSYKEAIVISIKILEDILDELLKIKVANFSTSAKIPNISFDSKIDLCYKTLVFKNGLRESLKALDNLCKLVTLYNKDYNSEETILLVLKLCKLNDNEMFNLILKIVSSDSRVDKEYKNLEELLKDMGVEFMIKFICSVICASLLEVLVELKTS